MASGDRDAATWLGAGLLASALAQLSLTTPAAAAADELPDIELLAYLGSWLDSDEEWVAVAEWDGKVDEDAPTEPAPEEENDDE